MTSTNTWHSIQALRGLAVLGVIAFHCQTVEQKYSAGDFLLPDFLLLGQSGVDLFFVISGFIMVTVTRGRFAGERETLRFLWGRCTRIYPTYWFYYCLPAAIFLVKPQWVNTSQGHQVNLFTSFFLLPDPHLPIVMVAWSLIHELWFYLVFALLLQFRKRFLLPALFLWGAIIIVFNFFITLDALSAVARIVLHPYSLQFILGALAGVFSSSRYWQYFTPRMALLGISFIVAGGLPFVYTQNILENAGLLRVLSMGALYTLLIVSCTVLEKKGGVQVPRIMSFLGDISYTVYLSHILVLNVVGRLWQASGPFPGSVGDNLLACVLMLAAVIGYGWLGYRCIERPISHISHRLRTRWFDRGDKEKSGTPMKVQDQSFSKVRGL